MISNSYKIENSNNDKPEEMKFHSCPYPRSISRCLSRSLFLYPFLTSYYIYLYRFICIPSMRFGDWRLSLASRQRPSRSYSIFMQPNSCHPTWRVVHDFFFSRHPSPWITNFCTFDKFSLFLDDAERKNWLNIRRQRHARASMIQIYADRRR